MPVPQLITLDLDDTLWPVVPTLAAAEATLQRWLQQRAPATAARFDSAALWALRNALLRERLDKLHDMNWLRTESLRRALVAAGDPAELAEPAFAAFLQARQQVVLYDEVITLLGRWCRERPLIAISNGNADINRIGLGHLFVTCLSAHQVGFAKPDPRIFKLACEHVAVAPDQALHIGDDLELDVRAARAAGMRAAWLRRPELENATALRQTMASGETAWPSLTSIDRELLAGGV